MEDQAGPSNMLKHERGELLKSGETQMTLHYLNPLSGQNPEVVITDFEKQTGDLVDVAATSVQCTRMEFQ
jgi:hypothetical protein